MYRTKLMAHFLPNNVLIRPLKYAMVLFALSFLTPVLADEQILLESKEVKITNLDLEAEIARIPQENRAEVLADRGRIRKLLEGLLITKTMAARARNANLDRDPLLSSQMELAADKVLAQAQMDRNMKAVTLPDFESRAHDLYQIDSEKYTQPEQVHVSHILVSTQNRSEEEALKRIQQIRTLATSGKNFEDLVLEYSDDPSAKNNKGDLGFFAPDKMVKPFSDAAFAMNTPGEISEPVKTKFGYHIIQFHEKKPATVRDFDKVKKDIIDGLRSKYLSDYRNKMLGEILSDPSLKLNEAAVDRFKTNMPETPVNPRADNNQESAQP